MKKLFTQLCMGFGALLLVGCSKDVPFIIDNPTSQPVKLFIDDQAITLKQASSEQITLKPGQHQLKSDKIGRVSFIVYTDRPGAIINPTLRDYVLLHAMYAADKSAKAKNVYKHPRTIVLGDKQFTGEFQKLSALFIEKQWDYALDQKLPQQITVDGEVEQNVVNKLFRAKDFIDYYQKHVGPAHTAKTSDELSVTQRVQFNQAKPLIAFTQPTLVKLTQPMRNCYQRYLQETNFRKQRKLQQCAFDEISRYTKVITDLSADITSNTAKQLDSFSHTFSHLFSVSVLVTEYQPPQKP